ncbi:hypothetical protein HA42_17310 [Pantoea deleyi]|nr:hypothetical protein HA42_17310 [Pantoea deleyi]
MQPDDRVNRFGPVPIARPRRRLANHSLRLRMSGSLRKRTAGQPDRCNMTYPASIEKRSHSMN